MFSVQWDLKGSSVLFQMLPEEQTNRFPRAVNEILLTRNMLFPRKIIFNFSAQLFVFFDGSLQGYGACAYPQKSRSRQELFNVTLSSPVFIGDSEIILKMIAKQRSFWTSSVLWNHTQGTIFSALAQQLVLVAWTLLTCSPDLVPPVTWLILISGYMAASYLSSNPLGLQKAMRHCQPVTSLLEPSTSLPPCRSTSPRTSLSV